VKRLVMLLASVSLAACGCGGAGSWQERLFPPSTASQMVRIESDRPDERREALQFVAADSGARNLPSVVKVFCLVAKTDKDAMVRAAAVRGLGVMQGEEVMPALSGVAINDRSPFVRMDAAASLGRQAQPEGMPVLVQALQGDSNSDVRVAAADSLAAYKDKSAALALVAVLRDPSLAVAQKAWQSLRYMTGQNLPRDEQAWGEYLESADNPFVGYGRPPAMPRGQNQRPQFTKGPLDFLRGLFAKDVREAELQ